MRTRLLPPILLVLLALSSLRVAARAQTEPPALSELAHQIAGEDANVRRKAAETLGRFREPEAVRLLVAAYRAEKRDESGVKAACATALGETGRQEAAAALKEMLADPDYWVRKKAAEALGKIPGEEASQTLLSALGDADARVRAGALLSLGKKRAHEEVLLKEVEDPDPRIATAALEALGGSGSAQALPALERALEGADWQVRYHAASLLANKGDPRGLKVLADAVRSGREPGAALREAAQAGCKSVPVLVGLYAEPAAEASREAILGALESQVCAESSEFFLQLALQSEANVSLRVRAASTLFDRNESLSEGQVAKVPKLLGEKDPDLLAIALQILLERGSGVNLPAVAPLARHPNPVVRRFALSHLDKYGGAAYEATFIEALSDPNGGNVRLALTALGHVGTKASLAAIKPLLQDRLLRRPAEAAVEAIEARQ